MSGRQSIKGGDIGKKCSVLRDNIQGITKPPTVRLNNNSHPNENSAIDPSSLYPIQNIGDPSTYRIAILQKDKVHRLSETKIGTIYDVPYRKQEYTYNKRPALSGGWGCEGSNYGCKPCNALAADRFEVPPTQAELGVNPDAQPVLRNLCKVCCYQLMDGRVPNGANNEIAPVSCIVIPGDEVQFKAMHANNEDSSTFTLAGGCPNLAAEVTYMGKLTLTNQADKMGDVKAFSSAIKVADEQKINNTDSNGESRLSGHITTAWYDDPYMPGQKGRTDTWKRTRDILTSAHPLLGGIFEEIETCNNLGEGGIYDGHMDNSRVERVDGAPASHEPGKFDEHTDGCALDKPTKRGILTGGRPIGKPGQRKIMRISDRKYGRWVDIIIDHGTLIEMDLELSGAISGRFTHSIRDAQGTYAIIMDYGGI